MDDDIYLFRQVECFRCPRNVRENEITINSYWQGDNSVYYETKTDGVRCRLQIPYLRTYSQRQPVSPDLPLRCLKTCVRYVEASVLRTKTDLYIAACKMPENLSNPIKFSVTSIADNGPYNVPTNPELVKMPERFPSSADLYHLCKHSSDYEWPR